jgi:hypothetical protein
VSVRPPALPVVGCVERVVLGDVALCIACRIDTGAATSALHVEALSLDPAHDEARFTLLGRDGGRLVRRAVVADVARFARVRSTAGTSELRAFVPVRVQLGEASFTIEVGLTDRATMRYPMLLGRDALAGRYLVDPGRTHLHPPREPEPRR